MSQLANSLPAPNQRGTLNVNNLFSPSEPESFRLGKKNLRKALVMMTEQWNSWMGEKQKNGDRNAYFYLKCDKGLQQIDEGFDAAACLAIQESAYDIDTLVYETEIRSAIDLILTGLESHHITCMGEKQSGKSMTIYLCVLFEPIIRWLADGKIYHPIVSKTIHLNLYEQGIWDLHRCFRLGQFFEVTDIRDGRSVPVNQYFSHQTGVALHAYGHSVYGLGDHVQRNSKKKLQKGISAKNSGIEVIKELMDQILEKGHFPLAYIDESHFGTKVGGNMDAWAGDFLRTAEKYPKARFRAFSATPYEQLSKADWARSYIWIGNNFCGLGIFEGERLPCLDGAIPEPPVLHSYATYFNIPQVLSPSAWDRIRTYLYAVLGLRGKALRAAYDEEWRFTAQHRQYRKYLVQSLATVIENCLIKNNVLDQPGMIIRLGNQNGRIKEIVPEVNRVLQERGHDILSLSYFDDKSKQMISTLITDEVTDGQKFVIYCSAGARMGCRIPGKCAYALDLTYEGSTTTSVQQGLWGRMHGYNKKTMVFVSDSVYQDIYGYVRSGGYAQSKPAIRARGGSRRGRPSWIIPLYREDIERLTPNFPEAAQMLKLFREIEASANKLHPGRLPEADSWASGSPNSKMFYRALEKLPQLVEACPQVLCDEDNVGMYEHIDMMYFTRNQTRAKQEQKKRNSKFLGQHPQAGGLVRRWGYSVLVGRRRSPQSKEVLAAMLNPNTKRRVHTRIQQRTTSVSDTNRLEAQVWFYCGTDKHCRKLSKKAGEKVVRTKKIKLIAVTLLARVPVTKTFPYGIPEPTEDSAFYGMAGSSLKVVKNVE